jgi:hypothetical protein
MYVGMYVGMYVLFCDDAMESNKCHTKRMYVCM